MKDSTRRLPARRRTIVAVAALATLVALVAAGIGSAAGLGPSWTVKLRHGGTFTLASSIQAKAKAHAGSAAP